jgi:7,8-dihydropterin-6-yl-methyl-4-(beta-D-ribofuranosyl)aminobenzene 5'-phosphate synthase
MVRLFAVRVFSWIVGVLLVALAVLVAAVELRNRAGVRKANAELAAHEPSPIGDFGATRTLTILPLIDWHASRPDLRTEMGVSYLIETDEHRVLFDVGQNTAQESPSPLELNMQALGVTLDTIDRLFISHNHFDHVGGKKNQKNQTFSLGTRQIPLPGLQAFVPIPMTYPGLNPVHAREPTKVGAGLASTGTIPRQLVFGWIDEQALVVQVADRGGVIILGCGHQTIPELLKRYDETFSEPLYGIVGGFHYPVPAGRLNVMGINAQRRFASGDGMLSPITMDDVEAELRALRARNLGLIGVGGHDSSDEVIAMFADAFGDTYRHVRVGEAIVIEPPG